MDLSPNQKQWSLCYFFIVIIILYLQPYLTLSWTIPKCNVAGRSMPVYDEVFAKRCALYNNATFLALCSNITDLSTDLADVPQSTEILCLSGNNTVILDRTFAKFQRMIYLAMKMPLIQIHPEAFRGLENLEALSISFSGHSKCNNLSFPENALSNLHSLKILKLEGFNLIKSMLIRLPSFTFLHTLTLTENCITDLFHVFHIFKNIVSIHTLNVGSNKIEQILNYAQNITCPNITELNLSKNPLKRIEDNALAMFPLRLINLDFTRLYTQSILNSGVDKMESLSLTSACWHANNRTDLLCSIADKFQLKTLSAPVNRFYTIRSSDITKCSTLQFFNLNYNRIRTVDPTLLYYLPNLKQLLLSGSFLAMNLCPSFYKDNFTSGLEILYFNRNKVSVLNERQFFCMTHLKELYLASNGINHIEDSAFWGLTELKILDLRNNMLKSLQTNSLTGLSNLREFTIENNELQNIQRNCFHSLTKLWKIQIGFKSVSSTFELFSSLESLDIYTYGKYLTIYMNDTVVSSLSTLSINSSSVNLDIKCNHSFFYTLKELKIFNNNALISCSHSGHQLEQFKSLENLHFHFNHKPFSRKLNFSNILNLRILEVENLADALDDPNINPNDLFHKLPKLEILKLINCGFRYISDALLKDMTSLKVLKMQNEILLTIDPGLQNLFATVKYIYFTGVTFQCDCKNSWFVTWALTDKSTFVSGISTAFCLQLNKKYNLLTFDEKTCKQNVEFILFVMTFFPLLLFITLTMVYNIFNSDIIQLIYIFHIWLKKLRGKVANPITYDYDAFVSYCSVDQDWVLKHLVPNLEEKGTPQLKLCLHNRDFQVGKDIVDNIMDSIYKSRKTICLISYNYLKSEWCSLEMRMATYRILAEKNDDLILIFLENISKYHLSAYHRLARMVKKKTYIDWPQEDNEQFEFWERLRMTILENEIDNTSL